MSLLKRIGMYGTALLAAGILAGARPADAQESAPKKLVNVSVDNSFYNKYVFWGLGFGDKPVWQPMVNVNRDYFTLSLFGNRDLSREEWNEADVFADFSYPIKKIKDEKGEGIPLITASLGGGYYNFKMGDWVDDQEVYAGLSFNVPFNPSVMYHRLFGLGKGDYVEATVSKKFTINKRSMILALAKLGYDNTEYREKSGLSHAEVGVSVPIQVTDRVSVTPSLNYSRALASDLEDEVYGGGGVNVHCDF